METDLSRLIALIFCEDQSIENGIRHEENDSETENSIEHKKQQIYYKTVCRQPVITLQFIIAYMKMHLGNATQEKKITWQKLWRINVSTVF